MNRSIRDTSRQHAEPADPLRLPFELDCQRILSCTAFRRLQNKTQVFAPGMHDHFRNRLTHSLEVAQIARCLARHNHADPELCEAIALAHDLGHGPFSHAGEKSLNELMAGRGGFNHNVHSLRVVEYLEHPYPQFRGLNLTVATLDGLRNHVTQFDRPSHDDARPISCEAHIVSLADRIAYDLHDLEDALGAKLIKSEDLASIHLWQEARAMIDFPEVRNNVPSIRRPVIDSMLNKLIVDLISRTPDLRPENRREDPRRGGAAEPELPQFSSACDMALRQLESNLLDKVYHHPDVARADAEGHQMIDKLSSAYMKNPDLLPDRFVDRIADQGAHRVICDYIAGMSDSYCSSQYAKHCLRS